MQLSEYYKGFFEDVYSSSNEELINGWVLACQEGLFELTYYATSDLLDSRELIYILGLESDKRVIEADINLISYSMKNGADSPMFAPKDNELKKWWWHLDKIASKTYPVELLPEYLRELVF